MKHCEYIWPSKLLLFLSPFFPFFLVLFHLLLYLKSSIYNEREYPICGFLGQTYLTSSDNPQLHPYCSNRQNSNFSVWLKKSIVYIYHTMFFCTEINSFFHTICPNNSFPSLYCSQSPATSPCLQIYSLCVSH